MCKSKEELVVFLNQEITLQGLFDQLLAQLSKDFSSALFMKVVFRGRTPEALVQEVYARLSELLTVKPESLSGLLYRIDVPEEVVNGLDRSGGIDLYLQQLTVLIVKRDWQKVYYRNRRS